MAPPARLVAGLERLGHQPLVALLQGPVEEAAGLLRVVGHQAGHAVLLRDHPVEGLEPLAGGELDEADPLQVEAVEEEGDQGQLLPELAGVPVPPEPAHDLLEGPGAAVVAEGEGLAVQDELVGVQGPHRLDDLRKDVGLLVQTTGEDPDPVAVLVGLEPGAVELVLEGGPAQPLQGVLHAPRGPGEHGLDGPEELEGEGLQRPLPPGQDGPGHVPGLAPEHHRPPDAPGLQPRGLGEGLDQQPLLRALTELAQDQAGQERLLVVGGPAEQLLQRLPAARPGPLARDLPDRAQRLVGLREGERRLVGGLHREHLVQRRRADPDLPVGQLAGEVGHRHRGLLGIRLREELRQAPDLLQARRDVGHGVVGLDQARELHPSSPASNSSACSAG